MPYKRAIIESLGNVRLNLELNPQPSLTGGNILAFATLTVERDNSPIEGKTVVFNLGDNQTEYRETDGNGKASVNFANLPFGSYIISVFLDGHTGLEVVSRHFFPWIAPPKLAEPKIDILGEDGLYKIIVSTQYENGLVAKDIPVTIELYFPKRQGQEHEEIGDETDITNKQGIYTYILKFDSYECDAIVNVGGYIKEFKNLAGPQKQPKPILTPEPIEQDLGTGRLRALMDGYKRGVEDKNRQRRRRQ